MKINIKNLNHSQLIPTVNYGNIWDIYAMFINAEKSFNDAIIENSCSFFEQIIEHIRWHFTQQKIKKFRSNVRIIYKSKFKERHSLILRLSYY